MLRTAPRTLSVAVALVLLAITVGLALLTWQVNANSEQSLLRRQLAQIGTLLESEATILQVQLADMGLVAVATDADPEAFARIADMQVDATGQSLSLWRVTDGAADRLASQGTPPVLPEDGADSLAGLQPTGELVILGILSGEPDRLAYALMPADDSTNLLVYAEAPLPPDRRLTVPEDSPLSGLDLALYLGDTVDPEQLLQATENAPGDDDSEATTVPFGNTSLTIVGAAQVPLSGALSAALPWIVLGVGVVLALAGGTTVEYVSRRRVVAERLAAENERLYRQQRGIAGTLQHALLPVVPEMSGLDVAARYVAGVDELEVGGDWYDVIARGPGCCVFVVGDISGRGLPAATTMAALRFAVRAYVAEGHDIEVVMERLRDLLDIEADHQFATVLLGELDATAGRLRLVSAGHFAPVLVAGGTATLLECPVAPPVGVSAPRPVPATVVPVGGAATLLAFTDGAVERRQETIDTGLERLRAAAAATGSRPLEAMLDDLLAELSSEGNKDDTVLLGLRWS
ncbi:PP2C family protein-serine/threonine phosphatase [Blastococcus goldschmidtiae]|uniref:PP2C family protein-serine/threonine phosphatase n=1 Tax=Blastococcus goldschmidtiae TaxID=3075546 RepID=A0ABU2K4X8_9ACTN|nr:PP2C family protein-serine/threonine phosphatase [Blastococcus sp. DSM 46792]MDT0275225.1 PP2C family protein-serine/threonine phosphatase [Blastococcus sp. DSM 46792]